MISGINTDIQYKGEVFHVQTEDGGPNNPVITTLLFKGGAIVSAQKTNYAEILQTDSYEKAVKEMMKEQHKNMVRELAAGKFDRPSPAPEIQGETQTEASKEVPPEVAKETPKEVTKEVAKEPSSPPVEPAPPKLSQKKSLDDLILDYLSDKEESFD